MDELIIVNNLEEVLYLMLKAVQTKPNFVPAVVKTAMDPK